MELGATDYLERPEPQDLAWVVDTQMRRVQRSDLSLGLLMPYLAIVYPSRRQKGTLMRVNRSWERCDSVALTKRR